MKVLERSTSRGPGRQVLWLRYTWQLARVPAVPAVPSPYLIRPIRPDEVAIACRVAARALTDEVIEYGVPLPDRTGRLLRRIRATLGDPCTLYLAAEWGGRIIGISGVASSHWSGEHLLTGIRVVRRHWDTGVEESLLAASLAPLREQGLREAVAVTLSLTRSALQVYDAFFPRREVVAHP